MSGETLRAPRQQLRRLRASAFDVALDFQGLLNPPQSRAFRARVVFLATPRRAYENRPVAFCFPNGSMSQNTPTSFQSSSTCEGRTGFAGSEEFNRTCPFLFQYPPAPEMRRIEVTRRHRRLSMRF